MCVCACVCVSVLITTKASGMLRYLCSKQEKKKYPYLLSCFQEMRSQPTRMLDDRETIAKKQRLRKAARALKTAKKGRKPRVLYITAERERERKRGNQVEICSRFSMTRVLLLWPNFFLRMYMRLDVLLFIPQKDNFHTPV